MEIINYSEAKRNFKAVLDRVADDQNCTVITRSGVEDAVIMSKSQYDSIMKTLYLMRSAEGWHCVIACQCSTSNRSNRSRQSW